MAAALHAQIGFGRSDQLQSSTPGQTTNGGLVLRYLLSETIQAQENGSRGTHFAKFLISNFLKGFTYSVHWRSTCGVDIMAPGRFCVWIQTLYSSLRFRLHSLENLLKAEAVINHRRCFSSLPSRMICKKVSEKRMCLESCWPVIDESGGFGSSRPTKRIHSRPIWHQIGKLKNEIIDKTNKSGTSIGKALGRRTHNKQLERNLQIGEHSILRLLAPQCLPGWSPAVTNYRHLSFILWLCTFFQKLTGYIFHDLFATDNL